MEDMRATRVPYLEPIVGAVWWTVGAAALDGGPGTVVLAAGLGLTALLVMALRGRHGAGEPLPHRGRGRFLRLLGITAALVAVAGTVLSSLSWGELAVPAAAALVGAALMMLSSQLDERSLVALGGALMVLGAAGALLALDSAGKLYPQGLVGLVAGALFWLTSAHRTGLLAEARHRVRR
ncbi:hypothetical protein CFP66_30585 [Pseudonocardia sp. MH-G8]|nr:hypothetical protein CFP66_30585 [Pseudonocardia sp. MH-G8]